MTLGGRRFTARMALGGLLVVAIGPGVLAGQTKSESPVELVRRTVENEIKANDDSVKTEFRDHKETGRGWQTRMVIETEQGSAGMLVAIDGKPLSPQQRRAEIARLDRLASDPQELKKKQKAEKEDSERTLRMVKAFPDAFLYEHADEGGNPGRERVKLNFRPNPNYDPPSHLEQVLTGMQGYVVIDSTKYRIAEINGTLAKDVGFGWGILGHLDKGGHFLVTQAEIVPGDWEVTRLDLDFKGKVLIFKSISIKSNEVLSDFRPAPANLTFAQAVELLKKELAGIAVKSNDGDGSSER